MATLELVRGSSVRSEGIGALERRALALWPRLDKTALRRCGNDPSRIAALISRRTSMPPEQILQVLVMTTPSRDDAESWFG